MEPLAVEAVELTRDFGKLRAVDRLSFEVRRGEIVGLLGPNGAGKTTTLRMLTGSLIPTAGEIRLAGFNVFREGPQARARLGYLPEAMPLYPEMKVADYLSFIARIKSLASAALDATLRELCDRLDLSAVWERPNRVLSRGYRQRVGLAQALLGNPELLVLDEPTAGLDPNQIREFRSLLRKLGAERAVLLSTHILPEALEVCDRVMILNQGRLVAVDSPDRLAESGRGAQLVTGLVGLSGPPQLGPIETTRCVVEGQGRWRIEGNWGDQESNEVLRRLLEQGATVIEWRRGGGGLEEVFRRLTLEEDSV